MMTVEVCCLYVAITVMSHPLRLVGDGAPKGTSTGHNRGLEQGNYSIPYYRGNLFHQMKSTQMFECAVKITHIWRMPLTNLTLEKESVVSQL